jgi:hypothetical protein
MATRHGAVNLFSFTDLLQLTDVMLGDQPVRIGPDPAVPQLSRKFQC